MTDKACSKCEYWQRDGMDGICFGGTPQPKILEKGKEYVLVWPRTRPEEYCPGYTMSNEALN